MRVPHRGLMAVVVAATVLGGCGEEADLEHGSSWGDARPTTYERGRFVDVFFTVRNSGQADAKVVGVGPPPPGFRLGRLRMQRVPNQVEAPARFRSFTLEPGKEWAVGVRYTAVGSCARHPRGGAVTIVEVPVRFKTGGETRTRDVRLRSRPRFRGARSCPGRADDE